MKIRSSFILLFILLNLIQQMFSECSSQNNQGTNYDELREEMVSHQIKARGITDPQVLKAMSKVERHLFVEKDYQSQAYNDYPLPIGEGQTISQPYIVALMTEMLQLDGTEKVLEVGTGSGYQAAILCEIADKVYTIEIYEKLGKKAKLILEELAYKNVEVKVGDGYQGWPEYAPFDCIIVTCAPTHIPEPLIDQLKEEGQLVIPVGGRYYQELYLYVKKNGKLRKRKIVPVRFVPMIDKKGNKY